MKEILLTQGQIALVDDSDFELVSRHNWFAHCSHRNVYAETHTIGNNSKVFAMHSLILGFPAWQIDHKDGNGLNNTRENLRPTNHRMNQGNARRRTDNTSGVKGVSRSGSKWQVQIRIGGKVKYIGRFDRIEDAARAYADAAHKLYGSHARLE